MRVNHRKLRSTLMLAIGATLAGCQSVMINPSPMPVDPPPIRPGYGLYYSLPRGLVTVTVSKETASALQRARPYNLEVSAPQFEPDPRHYYRIDVAWSIGSDDTVVVETTDQGILKSIQTTAKDQSVEIVNKLVELAGAVAQVGAGLTNQTLERKALNGAELQISHRIDPADKSHVEALNRSLQKAGTGVQVVVTRPPIATESIGRGDDLKANEKSCTIGVCFRPLIPYEIALVPTEKDTGVVYQRATTLLPNEAPVLSIGITRSQFVEKKSTYTFAASGIPSKADLSKPSEALGFVGIPIAVAKAIVSIPAELFSLRVKQIESETSHIQKLTALLDAQQKYLEALEAARQRAP